MTDDKMTDEALLSLKTLRTAAPSPEARKAALNAAMAAFDQAQAQAKAPARRNGWFFSRWKLGTGFGALATAAAALVLVPLGTQMYSATSHRMDAPPPVTQTSTAKQAVTSQLTVPVAKPKVVTPSQAPVVTMQTEEAPVERDLAPATIAPDAENEAADLAVVPEPSPVTAAPAYRTTDTFKPAAPESLVQMRSAPRANATVNSGPALPDAVPLPPSGDTFAKFDENHVKVTRTEPVSTFSIDVDTASYSYVRGLLKDGYVPGPDAVRLEELINYFPYDYPAPTSLETPFQPTLSVMPTPWNSKTQLLEIGIKGYVPPAEARQPQNLTFLVDTSGSMDEPNKLPLLKRSFSLLIDQLRPDDTVSIVTYAGSAGVALKPTKAKDRSTILGALDQLYADGSTNGSEGIALAYSTNDEARTPQSVNRVILATDGDFNVGIDEPDALKRFIKSERDKGIFLSVLGFGRGNLDDETMQALAQNGNGNASYIDNFQEAQKVLVEEGGANLITIAKDVKIQVEFNPAVVSEYRLIGYETRTLANEDFNNDAVDAGEVGAGHTVTALYEITPAGSGGELNDPLRYGASSAEPTPAGDELGFLKIRYKAPDGDTSKLIETPIGKSLAVSDLSQAGTDQRFAAAVAAFGQKLKASNYGETMSWREIADLANGAKGTDPNGYRAEFVQLVKLAATLDPDQSGGKVSEPSAPSEVD